jgi:hypothetical protein
MRQSLESQGWFVEAGALHAACRSDIVVNTVDVRAVIELMIHGLDKSRVVFKQTTFRRVLYRCVTIFPVATPLLLDTSGLISTGSNSRCA